MDKRQIPVSTVLTGSLMILIGIVWVLRNFGAIDLDLKEWWPLILIGIGLLNVTSSRNILSLPGSLFIAAGIVFLLTENHILEWGYLKKFWPLIIVIIGFSILSGHGKGMKMRKHNESKENHISGFALFAGFERKVSAKSFRGGEITAIFGGAEVDLTNASLNPEGAVLEITAVFGGVEIRLPDGWNVEISSTALFGGVGNKYRNEIPGDDKPLRIHATAVFGGVEIKN